MNVRLPRLILDTIDAWRTTHPNGEMSRPEAIRQLITIGLAAPDSEDDR